MDGGGRREKEGRLEEGGESRTEEEGRSEEGPASGEWRGRTEEEAGTESSEEDEATAAQIRGGATGEDRRRGG